MNFEFMISLTTHIVHTLMSYVQGRYTTRKKLIVVSYVYLWARRDNHHHACLRGTSLAHMYFSRYLRNKNKTPCVWRPRPSLSICDLVSTTERVIGFLWNSKLFCKKFPIKREFCENRFRDSHTLAWGVREFLPILPMFLDRLCRNLVQETCT
jgi:hypothetical protein